MVFSWSTDPAGWPIEAKLADRRATSATRYHQRTATVPGRFGLVKFVERPDKLPDDVLAPYREGALDQAAGNDDQFLRGFYNAMRDLALDTLTKSESQVRTERPKFAGKQVPDRAAMNEVAQLLADKDAQLERTQESLDDAGKGGRTRESAAVRQARIKAEKAPHEQALKDQRLERAIILQRAPVLAMVKPKDFLACDKEEQAELIHGQMGDILENIETTRENLLNDELSLWDVVPIVSSTMQALGIDPEGARGKLILEKASDEKTNELIANIATAVLQIGLAIGAVFATGGLALVLGGAGLAVGAADAAYQTDRYFTRSAAAATAIDPSGSILNPDELGMEGFWVVVSWVGVGIDVAGAVKAVKALKAGKAIEEVLTETAGSGVTREMLEQASSELKVVKEAGEGAGKGIASGASKAPGEVASLGDEAASLTDEAGQVGQGGARLGDEAAGLADELSPGKIVDEVSNRLREHAGIDASTVQKWTAEHGAAKASEMMGDELLKAAGLNLDDALRLMRENPHKFYQEYGALCASAVLRRGAGARAAAKAAQDIVGAVPEAQLVEFADEMGFAMMTHFTPDSSALELRGRRAGLGCARGGQRRPSPGHRRHRGARPRKHEYPRAGGRGAVHRGRPLLRRRWVWPERRLRHHLLLWPGGGDVWPRHPQWRAERRGERVLEGGRGHVRRPGRVRGERAG